MPRAVKPKPQLTFRRFCRYAFRLGPRAAIRYAAKHSSGEILKLKVRGVSTPVYCRSSGPDFWVLYELIGKRHCNFPFRTPPRLIVDAGAHVGFATLFYANRWPKTQIIALEPEKNNCKLLRMNCANYPNVTVVEGALWNDRTPLRIVNPGAASWEFRVDDSNGCTAQENPVQAYTVSDLIELSGQSRISLLKVDIEGAELQVFANNPPWLDQVDAILIELHDRFQPGSSQALELAVQGRNARRFQQGEYEAIQLVA
jgi:FkbM family methyltransferase